MKHRLFALVIIVLCCIFGVEGLGFAESELPEYAAQLYDFSIEKATELYAAVSAEGFKARYKIGRASCRERV